MTILEWLKNLFKKQTLENYYNNKYPEINLTYKRVETDGIYQVDLRNFINRYDSNLPSVEGISDDNKALAGITWIINNIRYVTDATEYKTAEYWAYSYQTLRHKKGDCEDGSILLYNMLLKGGVPYWKLRLTAGFVIDPFTKNKIGHAYLTYYCEEIDKWIVLDWCFLPNTLPINERKDYKDETNYTDVWFSWNEKYCYSEGLNTNAKRLLK